MGMECDVARGPKKVMDEGEDAELTSLKKPGRGAAWRSGVKARRRSLCTGALGTDWAEIRLIEHCLIKHP